MGRDQQQTIATHHAYVSQHTVHAYVYIVAIQLTFDPLRLLKPAIQTLLSVVYAPQFISPLQQMRTKKNYFNEKTKPRKQECVEVNG